MIVLLTDFGQSEYVGVMKGVILGIDPSAQVVDLCHSISPQCIVEASWVLKNNYAYFPKGSTFCCVVDPGVGSRRRAIAVKTEHYTFVAPDNGLLWETLEQQAVVAIRELPVPQNASRTFHGRDIFARAAAETDLGRFDTLGKESDIIEKLDLRLRGREGTVVRVDHFGNVVTNLPPLEKSRYAVDIGGDKRTMPFFSTYEQARDDELFLITGSSNTLEISLKNAGAIAHLNLTPGQGITVA